MSVGSPPAGRPDVRPGPESPEARIELERVQFKSLLLQNPNYFGNLAESPFPPVNKMAGNTRYEQLTCIGFNPDLNSLEATVQIKLPFGFSGNLCMAGSTEYVRFFVDYGSGFVDAGMVAFNPHDIPNFDDCAKQPDKPLSYVVSLPIDPQRNFCRFPVLPLVRGILSWNVPPPANPGWPPVWGNVLDQHIQIKPRLWLLLDVIQLVGLDTWQKLQLPPVEEVGPQPIPLPDPAPLNVAELAKLYRGQAGAAAVEPHRFGHADLMSLSQSAAFDQQVVASKIAEWKGLGLDFAAAAKALAGDGGNTTYEEIQCLGLDYNREWLAATFTIKRPNGYSGDLCTRGSVEYVAFWADWDNTCDYTYLGTVQVNVHDIAKIPADGLHYTAVLPVDLNAHRQSCDKPKIGRVRAVLSWNVAPSTTDPDALTFWGNRLDAHVQIKPGEVITTPTPVIGVLGGIPISKIDLVSGMTTFDAFFALNGLPPDAAGRPCPFGARVVLQGPTFLGYKYQVQVRRVGDIAWTTVTQTMKLVDWTGTIFTTQAADLNGYFTFVPFNLNVDNVLAWWDTAGDDLWEIKLTLADIFDNPLPGVAMHRIQLDNTAPTVEIHVDSGGDCKDFNVGTNMAGHFVATDANFGSFSLGTSPFAAPPGHLVPTGGSLPTAPAPGNAWNLDTTGMQPCGYVIVVTAVDRTIVNSASVGHWNSAAAGFCVRAPQPPA